MNILFGHLLTSSVTGSALFSGASGVDSTAWQKNIGADVTSLGASAETFANFSRARSLALQPFPRWSPGDLAVVFLSFKPAPVSSVHGRQQSPKHWTHRE
ncbi:MAG: hypothetical protein ABI273_16845 [Lacunisphaera sp.]